MSKPAPLIRLPPKPRRGKWALAFFAILFAVLLATKVMESAREHDLSGMANWILWGLILGGFVGWFALIARRTRQFNAENEAALATQRCGDLDAARERFNALA